MLSIACSIPECNKRVYGKGYCAVHWRINIRPILNPRHEHGMSRKKEYKSWLAMKNRCLNKGRVDYKYYGGRGIKIHPDWVYDFKAFYDYVGEAPKDHTLDRIDANGNYEPGNVRWADKQGQNANKRLYKANKTGHTNIRLLKNGHYLVRLNFQKKRYQLGTYESLDKAVEAYNEKLSLLTIVQ